MAINRGARASSHPTQAISWQLSSPTRPLHLPHKHTLAQGSFGRSSIVRPPVLSLFVRLSDRSIVRPIVHGSFVHSSDRSIVRPFDRPNNLFPAIIVGGLLRRRRSHKKKHLRKIDTKPKLSIRRLRSTFPKAPT
jgi:hypothetical protein